MARGGITEHLVEQARRRVLERGENPSIDAIRVELGNTGSKTTISRHLKSIEERTQTREETQDSLSEHLKDLVGELAARLLKDAQDKIDAAEEQHLMQVSELEGQVEEISAEREQLVREKLSLTEERDQLVEQGGRLQSQLSDLTSEYGIQAQRLKDLEDRLEDRAREIASLERKHDQARETLELYREQAQAQRAADIEQYEKAVNEAQKKAFNLEDELRGKTQEQVASTREITRLHAELMEARKNLTKADQQLEKEQVTHRDTWESKVRLEQKLAAVKQERDGLKVSKRDLDQQKARADRLQVELDVTRGILDELKEVRRETGKASEDDADEQ